MRLAYGMYDRGVLGAGYLADVFERSQITCDSMSKPYADRASHAACYQGS